MTKRRRIRADRFRTQLAENVLGPDGLVEVEVNGDGDCVYIRLPLLLPDGDPYPDQLNNARTADDPDRAVALVVLGHHPDRTAEDQLDLWLRSGNTLTDLAAIFAVETQDARERLGNFRYSG